MNVVMVGAFIKGMETSGTIAGTGLATATNFVAAGIYGIAVWNENFNERWAMGMALVLAGVVVLSTVSVVETEKSKTSTTRKTKAE